MYNNDCLLTKSTFTEAHCPSSSFVFIFPSMQTLSKQAPSSQKADKVVASMQFRGDISLCKFQEFSLVAAIIECKSRISIGFGLFLLSCNRIFFTL